MSIKSLKRGSPGAEDGKNQISVEISDDDAGKLREIQRDLARTELILERQAQKTLLPVFEKRRSIFKGISQFWPVALMNHTIFAYHAQHSADQTALSALEDVWVVKDAQEHRCFTIEFYFKENQFFSDRVLKKEYKFITPPNAANSEADVDGITPSMLDFSWERDVRGSATKIDWKAPDKALTKLYPRVADTEMEDEIADYGSFFHFFEQETDPSDIGLIIANEIFPEAIEYFLGNAGGEEIDSDEESDEDEEDAEEIDLEKPKPKKQRV